MRCLQNVKIAMFLKLFAIAILRDSSKLLTGEIKS
jgi:hypothetical protein